MSNLENIDVQNLQVTHNTAANRFETPIGDDIGVVEYRKQGDIYTINHTEIPPEYRGQGIGDRMLQITLDMLKAEGSRVRPLCPFVKAYIKRHPEYQSLLA